MRQMDNHTFNALRLAVAKHEQLQAERDAREDEYLDAVALPLDNGIVSDRCAQKYELARDLQEEAAEDIIQLVRDWQRMVAI